MWKGECFEKFNGIHPLVSISRGKTKSDMSLVVPTKQKKNKS